MIVVGHGRCGQIEGERGEGVVVDERVDWPESLEKYTSHVLEIFGFAGKMR